MVAELVVVGAEPAGETPQPVEDDQDITAAQLVETRGEVRAIGRGAGGAERVEFAEGTSHPDRNAQFEHIDAKGDEPLALHP